MAVYDEVRANRFKRLGAVRSRPGDPQATGPAILELVDAEDPPLRVFLGSAPLEMIRPEYASRIETWERWNELSVRAQGSLDE